MSKLVIDLDGTLTVGKASDYSSALPNMPVVKQLRNYFEAGFIISIFTARNMRTYDGDLSKIQKNTLPIIIEWLKKYKIPYHEIIVVKPWCHADGFYVDDRAIRPSGFVALSEREIAVLLEKEKRCF